MVSLRAKPGPYARGTEDLVPSQPHLPSENRVSAQKGAPALDPGTLQQSSLGAGPALL